MNSLAIRDIEAITQFSWIMEALPSRVAGFWSLITFLTAHVKLHKGRIEKDHWLPRGLPQLFFETTYQPSWSKPSVEAGVVIRLTHTTSETDMEEERRWSCKPRPERQMRGITALALNYRREIDVGSKTVSRERCQYQNSYESTHCSLRQLVSESQKICRKPLADRTSWRCSGQGTIRSAGLWIFILTIWLRDHRWMVTKSQNRSPSAR